jgi:hypothetical protein
LDGALRTILTAKKMKITDSSEIITRIAIWGLIMCVQALSQDSIRDMVPFDQSRLVFNAALEILSITLLLRFPDSSISRNMIDLSIYTLLYKVVLIESYFLNAPLYLFLTRFVEAPFMLTLYIWTFIRLLWVSFGTGHFVLTDWPEIGPYGWAAARLPNCNIAAGTYFYLGASLILAFELAVIATGLKPTWQTFISAGTGLTLIAVVIRPLTAMIRKSHMEHEESAALIAEYENTLLDTGRALANLRSQHASLAPHAARHLTVVPTHKKKRPDSNGEN